jgi:tRNA(Ile)-lysidine synthase
MKRIEQKILRFIDERSLISEGDKLLVAFSGGPDSVFALSFLNKYKRRFKIDLCAVHFNHQLRDQESNADETFAEKICKSKDIPLVVVKLNAKAFAKRNKISIEEAARKLRYRNLEMLAEDLESSKIVTAHNQSDNTETMLINLFSGTGSSGISGIPITRGNIIRPLLSVTKQDIISYLQNKKIPFRIDSSNFSDEFKRNYIRNNILPLIREKINPSLDEAMFRTAKNLEGEIRFNRKIIEHLERKFVAVTDNTVSIKIDLAKVFDGEVPGVILKSLFKKYFDQEFEFDDYLKINSLVDKQKGKKVDLGGKLFAFREEHEIRIQQPFETSDKELELKVGKQVKLDSLKIGIEPIEKQNVKFTSGGKVEFISADNLKGPFVVRKWQSGDRFKPLGMKNFKKVSDFLTDIKIPTSERKKQIVLLNRNHIVWIVGLRIDDRFKMIPKTKTIYKLWIT